ncbi:major facilitator superfamily domain-containing protein [Melanogaster broomeanus]|nr:major facilitator superfamily domain-containing protein [Melanogaster broomeanus]
MIAGLSTNIQNPANAQIEQQLHATPSQISLSLSLFMLVQGNFPVIWSAVSDFPKLVYLFSVALFILGSVIVAVSRNIGLVIGMRVIQAAGYAHMSVICLAPLSAIGAATLADIYRASSTGHHDGRLLLCTALGPSLGPIIGGALTQGLSWRAVFWFLVIWGGVIFAAFFFLFHDTFRKERSLAYQSVLKRQILEHKLGQAKDAAQIEEKHVSEKKPSEEGDERQAASKDVEAQPVVVPAAAIKEIKLSLADVNPFPPYLRILSRRNNVAILIPSGQWTHHEACFAEF